MESEDTTSMAARIGETDVITIRMSDLERLDIDPDRRRGGGPNWLWLVVVVFLLVGAALSIAAYAFGEPDLTALESLGAGFGGLAGIILGLIAALIGTVISLIGAVFGLIIAAGTIAVTIFFIASPVVAIILFFLLMREKRAHNRALSLLRR